MTLPMMKFNDFWLPDLYSCTASGDCFIASLHQVSNLLLSDFIKRLFLRMYSSGENGDSSTNFLNISLAVLSVICFFSNRDKSSIIFWGLMFRSSMRFFVMLHCLTMSLITHFEAISAETFFETCSNKSANFLFFDSTSASALS